MDKHKKVGVSSSLWSQTSIHYVFLEHFSKHQATDVSTRNCPKCLLPSLLWWASIHDNTTCLDVLTQTVMTKSASYMVGFFFYQRDIFSFGKAALWNAQLFHNIIVVVRILSYNSISLCATWLDFFFFSLVNCCTKIIFSHRLSF